MELFVVKLCVQEQLQQLVPTTIRLKTPHVLPQQLSYSHAYLLFQGQESLRAELVQQLLECCLSYKVKRLFLHLAKKCRLAWLDHLNVEKIDLGRGK